jgi:hypothetical protein
MNLQDVLAVGALAVGLLALPAAWAQVRSTRKVDGKDTFRAHLVSLRGDQLRLTQQALGRSPERWRVGDFPMLVRAEWIPDAPFDLSEISIEWQQDEHDDDALDAARQSASKVLSKLRLGLVDRYSTALAEIAEMNNLFDGKIYRLVDVELTPEIKRMAFTESSYFAYLDTSEVLALEAECLVATKKRIDRAGSHRRSLGDPFDFRNRVVSLGIDTLTIRVTGQCAGFFLHRRDPRQVVNNANLIGVIPAGEFTPSDVSSEALMNDLDIWKNIMREYAEEMLGVEDALGQSGRWIDYAAESPYRELNDARANGLLKVKVLGLGIDPLPWKPELLTVCIIESQAFDAIFADVPKRNDEGLILRGNGKDGLPFDAATIARYCKDHNISPNTKALLQLAWRFRAELGLGERKPGASTHP